MQTTKLSKQAIMVLAVVLQKAIIEQASVVDLLGQLKFVTRNGELEVSNPPTKITVSEADLQKARDEINEEEKE